MNSNQRSGRRCSNDKCTNRNFRSILVICNPKSSDECVNIFLTDSSLIAVKSLFEMYSTLDTKRFKPSNDFRFLIDSFVSSDVQLAQSSLLQRRWKKDWKIRKTHHKKINDTRYIYVYPFPRFYSVLLNLSEDVVGEKWNWNGME